MMCLHMSRKAHVACNFNYLFENEGLLNVTGSHIIHCNVVLSRERCKIEML